ncbi:N-acetylneuraminate synthase [Sinorhizobium mexicanum]|uniref:N-acetylneuraminate synthase n=1 Tax=Sinorhizobium mexicanum TaxID=375549 RepID=A0A859R247_9HYPH|nr:N-acetylneuraminate synthase [Sinorhizobium mexicanum]MBP1888130.1 N-acetylneuraminate synthase/N,N'-diacetyllegionaminate synthase [Sinorhizobium mexicanum]QLL65669.1 N-acetylneuraminate synthase [Sinorhizobium mexicanum]
MSVGFKIGDRAIGHGEPCFVIAEIGVNHNGSIELAERMISAARKAGADAVKFQTFRADRLVVRDTPTAAYQKTNTGETNQHQMLSALELDARAHERLLKHCSAEDIIFLSSPFDRDSIDLLDAMDVPAFKVPSPDCVSTSYLTDMGKRGRPVILSTGMCAMEEVMTGISTLRNSGCNEIAVLHCTSCYPAPLDELHLRAIPLMQEVTSLPIGYSDHSEGIEVVLAAVALGACIIEKHFTLDRGLPGPDHRASLEPAEFAAMVKGVRIVERSLGQARKEPQPCEASSRRLGRRSLAAARDMSPGEKLSENDIILLRPGTGLAPSLEVEMIGKRLKRQVRALTLYSMGDFE